MSAITLSIYGASLSTIVFVWQLWRAWSERRRISTSYNFRGIDDPGNEILLINHSPKPITIYNTELFWGRRYGFYIRRFWRVGTHEWGDEDSDTGTTIDPFKITTIYYSGERHFHWRYDKRPTARLYLRMQVVGRKWPVILNVYRQNHWSPNWLQRQLVKIGIPYRPYITYLDEPKSSGLDMLNNNPGSSDVVAD